MDNEARQRIDALLPLLKDSSSDVVTSAAEAIERLEALSSLDELLLTLKNGDLGAKVGVIHALGKIGGEKVLPPLVYCAKRPEEDLRAAAVTVLGRLAEPATLTVIIGLLDDENSAVQGRAIAALAGFQVSAVTLEKLRLFLDANDGVLEGEAALTLAALKDIYSLERITKLLASTHIFTRQAAATAISLMPL